MDRIGIEAFGKDHWALLGYVETLCVDGALGVGTLDNRRVRCNPARHPLKVGPYSPGGWSPRSGTRLQGFADRCDPQLQLGEHDDWDCLDDLEAAGLVSTVNLANGWIKMTAAGIGRAAQIRAHKAGGGNFASFSVRDAIEMA